MEFYAKADDEYRCRKAVLGKAVLTIAGVTAADGTLRQFTGRVQSVEASHTSIPGYPLRITIEDQG